MNARPSDTADLRPDPSSPLLEAVYDQLRAIAQQRMSEENPGHTLRATELVHEAFLRIGQNRRLPFQSKSHFFATAAEAMRRILIDHARAKGAVKRGGPNAARAGEARVVLSVLDLASDSDPSEILALDQAMHCLEIAEPEVATVVRLRFFAGLSGDDTAAAMGISPRQVDRLWAYARAWLVREMAG